jgi:hypothetical protein
MRPINITITQETADALLWALREYLNIRTPVREYVDKRYAHMDESFRNCKIGDVQTRLDRLQSFIDRTQTQLTMEREYEKAK